jgi:homopolymeric O-antigen transport system ATP-binding protein
MSDVAISVKNLGKQYRIGGRRERHDTFTAALTAALASPFRRLRRIGKPVPAEQLFWALRNISFELSRGEVLGVIGRNGAGKSTLLKLLSRITEPTEGRMEIHGRLGSLLEVGTGFHPELTGRENIYLNGTILGMRRHEISRKFDEIVAFSGIETFLDTPVKRYSSGMYVRLAFAVAAHLEPEILVVDEVLAVGDVEFQKKCLGKMSEVAGEGRTVLFVSHNMAAVKNLCTQAMLLQDGKIVTRGDVESSVVAYLDLNSPVQEHGMISETASRIGTGEALLRRVTLTDDAGQITDQVMLGQPFNITTLFEIKNPIEDVFLEVGISTLDGLRVATVQNIDEARPGFSLKPGLHEITAEIDVTLLPREYVIDVVIGHLSGLIVDWVERTLQFSALNVARDSTDHYRWGEVRGFVRPKSVWHGPHPVSLD